MQKVYVDECITYTWECPICGMFNEEQDEEHEVCCEDCGNTFITTNYEDEHGEEVEDEE